MQSILADSVLNLFQNLEKVTSTKIMFVPDFIVIVVAGGLSFLPLLESVIWVP